MENCDICGKNTHEKELGWHQAVDCKPMFICWCCEGEHTDEELYEKIHKERKNEKN